MSLQISNETNVESSSSGINWKPWLFIVIILLISSLLLASIALKKYQSIKPVDKVNQDTSQPSESAKEYLVTKVIDGDTIEVSSDGVSQKIRYIGVNTPETVKPNSPVECFGKEASAYNKSLVEGKKVTFEKDVSETDRYNRTLRYVYVKDSDGNSVMVNKKLVDEGYAYSSTFPPDVKYQQVFTQSEQDARKVNRGLWAKCPIK